MTSKFGIVLILVLVLGLLLPESADAFDVPPGFADDLVVGDLSLPTSIAWLPDGDLLVTSQGGELYRWSGSGDADQILDLSDTICSGGETGLLGLAVDPDFDSGDLFVYLYYTDKQGGGGCGADNRANRVSRFTLESDGNVDPSTEEVLVDNIPAPGGNHNGGDLQFDKNGLLYVSVGDGGEDLISGEGQNNNGNARRLSLLNGKILRIETDGSIPAGNPFTGNGTTQCASAGRAPVAKSEVGAEKKNRKAKKRKRQKRKQRKKRRQLRNADTCQEIFATGLRNPYRIAFDPDDGPNNQRFFINDVGGGAWEEIDEGAAGADYGWNIREGPCRVGSTSNCAPDNRFVEPLFAYDHSDNCRTITGGAFVPDGSGWPSEYLETYLYADFICDTLFAIPDDNPGDTPEVFGTGTGATHLAFGPNDALYYTTFDGGGQVRRIVVEP